MNSTYFHLPSAKSKKEEKSYSENDLPCPHNAPPAPQALHGKH
jgi:hypothetical protein